MVLREGVETVLILSAVTLNSTELMSFIGTVLGVTVAILFGVMFVKGSIKINLQKFFRVTTAILFLVAAQLVIGGLHELSENGVLPSSRQPRWRSSARSSATNSFSLLRFWCWPG
jgi:high-affinity iron transporter